MASGKPASSSSLRERSSALVVVLVAALAACGSNTNGDPDAPAEATQEATQTEAAPERCLDLRAEVVEGISEGLQITGGGSLRFAQAVKSDDFGRVYFISADLQGWALTGPTTLAHGRSGATFGLGPNGPGLVYAVDAVAKEFSNWGDGSKTDANLTMGDDGAEESRDCVRSVAGR